MRRRNQKKWMVAEKRKVLVIRMKVLQWKKEKMRDNQERMERA